MRKALTLLVALFAVSVAFGQVTLKPGIGLNWTDFSKNPDDGSFKMKTGWHVGASALFGNKIYGELGAFYVEKTTEFSSTQAGVETTTNKLKGVRVPLNVGWNIIGDEESLIDIHAFGGVSGFFLTSAVSDDEDIKEFINDVQWGVFAGAGIDIWLLYLDLSYEWSLTDISTESVDIGQTRGLYATLGVRIPLGRGGE